MIIRVLMFAVLAERTGQREATLELEENATVGDALRVLEDRHPALREFHSRLATAVNMVYVRPDQRLATGDELALIPPVSGG